MYSDQQTSLRSIKPRIDSQSFKTCGFNVIKIMDYLKSWYIDFKKAFDDIMCFSLVFLALICLALKAFLYEN